MVNVSKRKLKKKDTDKLFDQLNKTVGSLNTKQSDQFLSDLLGEEEKIMLAKRLAAIILLACNQSIYRIANSLKISTSTAKNYKIAFDNGHYDLLLAAIKKKKNGFVELLETVDSILHLGGILPHYGQTHASERYKKAQDESEQYKNPFG